MTLKKQQPYISVVAEEDDEDQHHQKNNKEPDVLWKNKSNNDNLSSIFLSQNHRKRLRTNSLENERLIIESPEHHHHHHHHHLSPSSSSSSSSLSNSGNLQHEFPLQHHWSCLKVKTKHIWNKPSWICHRVSLKFLFCFVLLLLPIGFHILTYLLDIKNAQIHLLDLWNLTLSNKKKYLCNLSLKSLRQELILNKTLAPWLQNYKNNLTRDDIYNAPTTSLWIPNIDSNIILLLQQALSLTSLSLFDSFNIPLIHNNANQRHLHHAVNNKNKKASPLRCLPYPAGRLIRAWRYLTYNLNFENRCSFFIWALPPVLFDETMILWNRFCEVSQELNIEWFADTGTGFGSLRHHDIIPWDDDVDIRMSENDWKRLYTIIKNGKYNDLAAIESEHKQNSFRSKIWLKHATTQSRSKPWKYPFLDIWTFEKAFQNTTDIYDNDDDILKSQYRFVELPLTLSMETNFTGHFVYPLHYRPMGMFWIPFTNRPIGFSRKRNFYMLPQNKQLPIFDECYSGDYNHIDEIKRIFDKSTACVTLEHKFPFVTRRIPRSFCPYNFSSSSSFDNTDHLIKNKKRNILDPLFSSDFFSHFGFNNRTEQKKKSLNSVIYSENNNKSQRKSRLLECFNRPQSPYTKIIYYNSDISLIQFHNDILKGNETTIFNHLDLYGDFSKIPFPWDAMLNNNNSITMTYNDTSNWPLFFVWECTKHSYTSNDNETLLLEQGIIEEFSIGGIPIGLIEICQGDYTDAAFDIIPR